MKFIILLQQNERKLEEYLLHGTLVCDDLIYSDSGLTPLLFNSLEAADAYREEHEIDGSIVELPLK
jgi:hypothetical protein